MQIYRDKRGVNDNAADARRLSDTGVTRRAHDITGQRL